MPNDKTAKATIFTDDATVPKTEVTASSVDAAIPTTDEVARSANGATHLNVDVEIPDIDWLVAAHHEEASAAIAKMSPSRSYEAESNLRALRLQITEIDPRGTDWQAFTGHFLQPGALVSLPIGSLILALDTSWAKAHWYAREYIKPMEKNADLWRVDQNGPNLLFTSVKKTWVRDLLGYLMTNDSIREEGQIGLRMQRR